jgi:hypothetical protein
MHATVALIPVFIIGLAFVIFCLVDLFRRSSVNYLPRWLWAIICVVSVPLGGIIYLVFGRVSEY